MDLGDVHLDDAIRESYTLFKYEEMDSDTLEFRGGIEYAERQRCHHCMR
jgi:hypothetical protein